ncbi:MAG TPA: 2-isopropylmalate synthase [bacterium]|nr:2-isopropylmalate synthase [bacterium]
MIINVNKPNLLEDIFPYSIPPRITFDSPAVEVIDGREVKFDLGSAIKRELVITDTSFRDGQQSRPPYTTEQMVNIYKMLHRMGGPNGVIRQTEFFLYTPNDCKALDKCRELGYEYPEITGWIRANKGDFRLVKEMGLKETGMLTSSSDYHIFNKQKQTRQQAFDTYIGVVEAALEAGVRPRCHLEDITRSDIQGFVIPFVKKLNMLSEQVPPELTVKVRLCDTLGFGLSYPGAKEPRSIPKLIYRMINDCGMPSERLEWHGHNDFHRVHTNGQTAWLYGCNAINTTLFSFGERCGNSPLEAAIMDYIALKGDLCGIDTRVITEAAKYFKEEIGVELPSHYPFAGRDFSTTRAGIHASGLNLDERIYNIFDTTALLDIPPRVAITDKSGIDGIVHWVNEFLGLTDNDRIGAKSCVKIGRWVIDQYKKHGRMTSISDEELEQQIKEHLPEMYNNRKSLK